jgi:hypothetical protein
MYLAAGDLTLTAASTVTSCVSHNHSGYLTSALMRGTVCLHNSNVTGRDTQFCVKYLSYCYEKKIIHHAAFIHKVVVR